MKLSPPTRKMILLSTIGGTLCGSHVALFLQHGFSPWIIFNFGIGLFCVWGAILIGAERHPAKEENQNS